MSHPDPALRRVGRELRRAVFDLLLPAHCAGCGEPLGRSRGDPLCRPCRAHLHRLAPPWCDRCGAPLLHDGARCAARHDQLVGLRFARAPLRYLGTGGALVRRLKFAAEFQAIGLLGKAMATCLDALPSGFRRPLLVPVPLHRARRRERGLDQAAALCEEVARRGGCERLHALRRVRATIPQGDPRVGSRTRNVEGAFAARAQRSVRGRAIILVDDVSTSGATAVACARVLRAEGAAVVGLLTACRAR